MGLELSEGMLEWVRMLIIERNPLDQMSQGKLGQQLDLELMAGMLALDPGLVENELDPRLLLMDLELNERKLELALVH